MLLILVMGFIVMDGIELPKIFFNVFRINNEGGDWITGGNTYRNLEYKQPAFFTEAWTGIYTITINSFLLI